MPSEARLWPLFSLCARPCLGEFESEKSSQFVCAICAMRVTRYTVEARFVGGMDGRPMTRGKTWRRSASFFFPFFFSVPPADG